jgi:hypothetical protein
MQNVKKDQHATARRPGASTHLISSERRAPDLQM